MRINKAVLILLSFGVLSTLSVAVNAETSGAKPPMQNLTGRVESVDIANGVMLVDPGLFGRVREINVNEETRIQSGGKELGLAELKPGDKVTVQFNASAAQSEANGPTAQGAEAASQGMYQNPDGAIHKDPVSQVREASPSGQF